MFDLVDLVDIFNLVVKYILETCLFKTSSIKNNHVIGAYTVSGRMKFAAS